MVHLLTITTIDAVLLLHAHTALEAIGNARLGEEVHLPMMSTMTEAMLEEVRLQEIHILLHREDMKIHMTVGLLLLLLEVMTLTFVEILTLDLEALLLQEATAAMAAVAAIRLMTTDDIRQVCHCTTHQLL